MGGACGAYGREAEHLKFIDGGTLRDGRRLEDLGG